MARLSLPCATLPSRAKHIPPFIHTRTGALIFAVVPPKPMSCTFCIWEGLAGQRIPIRAFHFLFLLFLSPPSLIYYPFNWLCRTLLNVERKKREKWNWVA